MSDKKKFASILNNQLEKWGFEPKDLATKLSVNPATVRRWCNEESITNNITTLTNITKIFEMDESLRAEFLVAAGADGTVPTNKIKPSELCPANLEELIRRDEECAYILQRKKLLNDIKSRLSEKFILLYGQQLVGIDEILDQLRDMLKDEYVPLLLTIQGFNAGHSLDAFVYDLAVQLTRKFSQWTKDDKSSRNHLKWKDFKNGKSKVAFYEHWHKLQQVAGPKKIVVMFKEIERLLDFSPELNPQILRFLEDFIKDPDNGYFLLAGSEHIQFDRNIQFSELIAKGKQFRVRHYQDNVVSVIFSSVEKYFTCEEPILRYFKLLCDGHPRILQIVFDTIFTEICNREPSDKKRIDNNDLKLIRKKIIEHADNVLWSLLRRLSHSELAVTWLISQQSSFLIDQLSHCSLPDLHDSVEEFNQYFSNVTLDFDNLNKGVIDLETREWVKWHENGEKKNFRFKFGLLPLWIHERGIKPDEVRVN